MTASLRDEVNGILSGGSGNGSGTFQFDFFFEGSGGGIDSSKTFIDWFEDGYSIYDTTQGDFYEDIPDHYVVDINQNDANGNPSFFPLPVNPSSHEALPRPSMTR